MYNSISAPIFLFSKLAEIISINLFFAYLPINSGYSLNIKSVSLFNYPILSRNP